MRAKRRNKTNSSDHVICSLRSCESGRLHLGHKTFHLPLYFRRERFRSENAKLRGPHHCMRMRTESSHRCCECSVVRMGVLGLSEKESRWGRPQWLCLQLRWSEMPLGLATRGRFTSWPPALSLLLLLPHLSLSSFSGRRRRNIHFVVGGLRDLHRFGRRWR